MNPSWKVALAHDWLNGMRGGERCLELIGREFPHADLYTLLFQPEQVRPSATAAYTSPASRASPAFSATTAGSSPLPRAIEAFRLPDTNLIISTSRCVAKGIAPPAPDTSATASPPCASPGPASGILRRGGIKRALLDVILKRLRRWDKAASSRVDHFVAISRHVQARIQKFYNRDSTVVYPPVATRYFTPDERGGHDGFDLVVSALVPYKRVDLAVQAYAQTGYPLKIAGAGTEKAALQKIAPPNVEFVGRVADEDIRALYRRCRLLIFPGEEDFGIVPLEAQACGKPVVAYGRGGLLETVLAGQTGHFFTEHTPAALADAVAQAAAHTWDPAAIRRHAEQFSEARFLEGLRAESTRLMGSKP